MNITRDMFLFSCYSGLRYSDVIKLTKSDFADGENLNLRMQKTKNMVTVPLTNKAKEILKKYAREDNKPIFPSRSNVCVNRDLKSIASSCKIKKRVHFHLARHTFATLIAISDPNAFKVMKLLGHKDIRMTQRYVDIDIEELSNTLKGIAIFN